MQTETRNPQSDSQLVAASETPQEKQAGRGGIRRFFAGIGGFFKKHKVLGVLLLIALVAVVLIVRSLAAASAGKSADSYSFVRTTTLTKGDLTDTVSTTGTVESSDTSTVTYSAAAASAAPKFKTVNVAVGDTVQEGDVIATLDTSDIEDSITKEKENIADSVAKAQTTYDRAVTSYNDAVDKYNQQKSETDILLKCVQDDRDALSRADASFTSLQGASDTAQAALEAALSAFNDANNAQNAALSALDSAKSAAAADPASEELAAAVVAAQAAYDNASTAQTNASANYTAAQTAAQTASDALTKAQSDSNYTALSQTESKDDSAYEAAISQLTQLESQVTQAKQNMDDAKSSLDKAGESDALDTFYDQLDACSLTAETSGKVTSLNASVGNTPSGTIATIQDVDSLKVSITVSESDINSLQTGMTCQITTDATDDVIAGTLTQIDPVAGDSGKFGAEVTVTDTDTALKIGMNATVKIILSATSDCFTVPIDAVGNDDDGSGDYVYRKTGGEGTEMTFEKVSVTTGATNDYYVEISSDSLAEGDVIRSSADLTQGIISTTDASSDALMFSMGGGQGSAQAAPDGGGGMGGGQGGERPSGGAPAGGQ